MIILVIIIDDDNCWSYFYWRNSLLILWFWKLWFSVYTMYSITDGVFIFHRVDRYSCVLQQCVWFELLVTFLNIGIRLTSLIKQIHVSLDIKYVRYKWQNFFILRNYRCRYSRTCKINIKSVLHFTHTHNTL
jgi:hypothetical protein